MMIDIHVAVETPFFYSGFWCVQL